MFYGQIEGTELRRSRSALQAAVSRAMCGSSGCGPARGGRRARPGSAAGRYLIWSDIPNNRMMRYVEPSGEVSVFRAPLQQLERQHRRQPGPTRHLRAPDAPRHAHRDRRLDFRHRRQVPTARLQLAQRRCRQIGQFHLVHRSRLRHRHRLRGRPGGGGDRRLPCLPRGPEDRRGRSRSSTDMVRPNGLAFSPDEKLLYVADTGATHEENGPAPHPPLRRVAGRQKRPGRRSLRRMRPPACSTAFASTGKGAYGPARPRASTVSSPTGR